MFSSKFLSKGIPTRNCARCQVKCDPGECPSNNLNWPAITLWSSQCHSCRGDMLAWCESSRDQSRDHFDLHPILIQVNSDENSHLSFIAISFKCPLLEVLLELLSHSSTRREFISVSEKLLLRALMYLQKKWKWDAHSTVRIKSEWKAAPEYSVGSVASNNVQRRFGGNCCSCCCSCWALADIQWK